MSARYLVNAGRLDAGSWYLNEELEGSRFLGEGGHFIDTLSWWVGQPTRSRCYAARRRTAATCTSRCASPTAPSARSPTPPAATRRFPKETLDVTGGGRNARLDNFAAPRCGPGGKDIKRALAGQDKGQRAELEALRRRGADRRRRCRSRSTRSSPPRGRRIAVGDEPRRAGRSRWRCEPSASAGTRAGCAGCRPPRWLRAPATRRASRRGRAARCGPAQRRARRGRSGEPPRSPTPLPPAREDAVPAAARARCSPRPTGILAGRLGGARRRRGPTSPTPDWFLDPVTGRRAPGRGTASGSTTATRR